MRTSQRSGSRAIGITEFAWALSFAVTVPVAGVLVERLGWRSPFVLVAGLATAGALAIVLKVPRDPIGGWRPPMPASTLRVRRTRGHRTALAPAICVGLALAAVGAVFVAFEVAVVASIALVSTATLDRHDRTRLFGALMASIACGNAVGAAVAPVLFARGSIALSAAVSALAAAAATVVLWVGLDRRRQRAANGGETVPSVACATPGRAERPAQGDQETP